MDETLAVQVWERAGHACEYCLMPQAFYLTPFEIDHIIAKQHGGQTKNSNLALSCLHCNSHKGPNVGGIDPKTNELTRLFNPRRHKWERHFQWDGPIIAGRTSIGRVTVYVLAMNCPDIVKVREALIDEGVFP